MAEPAWLSRFRALALSLPEATQEPHFDRPSFRVRRKIFATLWEADGKAMLKLTPEQQDDYVQVHPRTIQPVHGTWGAQGATLVNLTGKSSATPSLLRELVTLAWRNTAPRSLHGPSSSSAHQPINPSTPAQQLNSFIARFDPPIARLARSALARLRSLARGASEMVYDNAYALVIGFAPNDRPSDAIFSIAVFPKKVVLCFIWGATLPDPDNILKGGGNQVRNIHLESARTLDDPRVLTLIRLAKEQSDPPLDPTRRGTLAIRAISKNQRPRRGAPKASRKSKK
jgi:hypothetical protein